MMKMLRSLSPVMMGLAVCILLAGCGRVGISRQLSGPRHHGNRKDPQRIPR